MEQRKDVQLGPDPWAMTREELCEWLFCEVDALATTTTRVDACYDFQGRQTDGL